MNTENPHTTNFKGVAIHTDFLSKKDAIIYFKRLSQEIPWSPEVVKMFGKTHILKRETAWFADDGKTYYYAGARKKAFPWNDLMLELREKTERFLEQEFNSCLLNLYPNGNSGMSWHSDDEREIDQNAPIASLSFGAVRKFSFKHKSSLEKYDFMLKTGSLLEMKPGLQKEWLHALPKTRKVKDPRINLTFRRLTK